MPRKPQPRDQPYGFTGKIAFHETDQEAVEQEILSVLNTTRPIPLFRPRRHQSAGQAQRNARGPVSERNRSHSTAPSSNQSNASVPDVASPMINHQAPVYHENASPNAQNSSGNGMAYYPVYPDRGSQFSDHYVPQIDVQHKGYVEDPGHQRSVPSSGYYQGNIAQNEMLWNGYDQRIQAPMQNNRATSNNSTRYYPDMPGPSYAYDSSPFQQHVYSPQSTQSSYSQPHSAFSSQPSSSQRTNRNYEAEINETLDDLIAIIEEEEKESKK